jgi:hypothetical protein
MLYKFERREYLPMAKPIESSHDHFAGHSGKKA